MAVRLMTDSTADLPKEVQKKWGFDVAPLGVTFGEKTFLQGVDITLDEFYTRLMASKALPTTTQVNPDTFAALFAPCVQAGDELVVFCVSSALSGTYQSACIAKQQFPGAKIEIIDTISVSLGITILLERAASMRDQGASAQEIVREIESIKGRITIYAIIDDLTYLHKGGRLSSVGARVGGVLRLKPVVSVPGGVVQMAAITRGTKNAYAWIAERVQKEGIDDRYVLLFGHTHAPELMQKLETVVFPVTNPFRTCYHEVGPVVGTHAGPGATAIAYIKRA